MVGKEDGTAVIMLALSMVVILGFAALVIDAGLAYVEKAELQNAADAAALAGAQELPEDNNLAAAAAQDYSTANGGVCRIFY